MQTHWFYINRSTCRYTGLDALSIFGNLSNLLKYMFINVHFGGGFFFKYRIIVENRQLSGGWLIDFLAFKLSHKYMVCVGGSPF